MCLCVISRHNSGSGVRVRQATPPPPSLFTQTNYHKNRDNVDNIVKKGQETTINTLSKHAHLHQLPLLLGFFRINGKTPRGETQCSCKTKRNINSRCILPGLSPIYWQEEGWCGKPQGIGKTSL